MDKRKAWLEYVCIDKSERDSELLRRASETLEKNICFGEEYPWYPHRGIMPSQVTYKGVWNWDCAFHAVGAKYWDASLAYDQFIPFIKTQQPSGMFLDVWYAHGEQAKEFTKPPVFPWAFEQVYRAHPNRELLKTAYKSYCENERFWCEKRKKDGLFFYSSENVPVNEAYAKCESGWDTSVRFDGGISNMWSIDLNCYMIMLYRSLEFMANELRCPSASAWREKAEDLAFDICNRLWDGENGYFCDTYFSGEHSKVLSPASFMPLYVGIASAEQAKAMLKVYEKHFYPAMPSVSYLDEQYTTDDYWRGPTWLNIAYFALKGLKSYGFEEQATKCKELILDWCYNDKRDIFEYYDSKSGKGLGAPQYGWSATFIMEFILNF